MTLLEDDLRLLAADGRRAHGCDAVRELLTDFLGTLRSSAHRITNQWHVDDVWIAEVDASYELSDWQRLDALPRAFVVRRGPEGIADVRVYGAHELPLVEQGAQSEGIRVGA